MKDTVTRITFFVGGAAGVGGSKSKGPVLFLWIFGGRAGDGLAKNSVIFLCTGFYLNHVQKMVL